MSPLDTRTYRTIYKTLAKNDNTLLIAIPDNIKATGHNTKWDHWYFGEGQSSAFTSHVNKTENLNIFINMIAPKWPRALHKLAPFASRNLGNTNGYSV